ESSNKESESEESEDKESESEELDEEIRASSSKAPLTRRGRPRLNAGILPLLSDSEIDDSTFAVQDLTNLEKNDVDELIVDLTTNLSDPTIELQINKFDHTNDSQILTEDVLDDEEIVSIVLDEQREFEE
ncbi:14130_t:CDS:2, partial [Racocetra fulgida]